MKSLITLLTAISIPFALTNRVDALEAYTTDLGEQSAIQAPAEVAAKSAENGTGYEDARSASYAIPAFAIGTIAIVGIIAVAVQNANSGHTH
jgi:hypothetical protein